MKYISTRPNNEHVSFKEAVLNGLTNNGGLYVPEQIPKLPASFFDTIEERSDQEIAVTMLKPFVEGSLTEVQLQQIVKETLSFPTPVVPINQKLFTLELFHGPTKAFKDVGARFMSRCLSHFHADKTEEVTILVATSGDTGSAVAHGFYEVPGVSVKILFPKGKISPYQEQQMTSLGKNISAYEVDGVFDDCQHLVKQAFNDQELRQHLTLSSANSINVARLLPQMLYYVLAYKQLKAQLKGKSLVVSVPSGNLGNITAGVIAQQMGLPITQFIAALNANDTFLDYLNSGAYKAKPSVATYSNAMDVGNPSNFERLAHMFQNDLEALKKVITSYSYSNEDTLKEIKNCRQNQNYMLDPHGAVGKLALEDHLNDESLGLFLGTAHPQKFSEVIQKVWPSYPSPELQPTLDSHKQALTNNYKDLKHIIFNKN